MERLIFFDIAKAICIILVVIGDYVPDYSVAAGIPAKVIKKYDFEKEEWVRV